MRSNALKRIRSNLINVPAVAFHPDHPLLLTGPDVLVGSEGLLFAFFVPTAHEFAHPNDLLARLTACRLVLPGHTFCAAVLDTETFSSELEHDFDKVIDKTDIARLIEHKEKRPSRTTNELAQIRSVAYGRAAIIFKEAIDIPRKTYARPTEVFQTFREQATAEYAVVPSWTKIRASRRSQRIVKSGSLLATAAYFSESQSVVRRLGPIVSQGLRLQYTLDNGMPYLTTDSVNTILVDEIPHLHHDPLKPMRSAAFFGWIMLAPESFKDFQHAVNKVDRRLRAAKLRV